MGTVIDREPKAPVTFGEFCRALVSIDTTNREDCDLILTIGSMAEIEEQYGVREQITVTRNAFGEVYGGWKRETVAQAIEYIEANPDRRVKEDWEATEILEKAG